MSGLIAKLLAYWRAPRKTFVLLHPLRAAKFGLAYLAGRKLFGNEGGKEPKRRSARRHPGRRVRRPRQARTQHRPDGPPSPEGVALSTPTSRDAPEGSTPT